MTDTGGRPPLDHNTGEMTEAEKITANLAEKHPKIIARAKEIADKLANVPEVIATQDESDKVSEFVRACMTFDKSADATRVEEKAPYLAGERAVDSFFNNLRDVVAKVKKTLSQRATVFDIKVRDAEEARRKEEARKAAEEAEILAAKAKTLEQKADAQASQQVAQDAAAAVAVKPAELTRTRTGSGVTRSLRVTWKHEVTEPKKVPKKFLAPSAALIDGAIKDATTEDGKCTLEIPGVRIYPHYHSAVR